MVAGNVVVGHGQMVHDAHIVSEIGVSGSGRPFERLGKIEKVAAVHNETRLGIQRVHFSHEIAQSCDGSRICGDVRIGDMHENKLIFVACCGLQREIDRCRQRLIPVALDLISRGARDVDKHRAVVRD